MTCRCPCESPLNGEDATRYQYNLKMELTSERTSDDKYVAFTLISALVCLIHVQQVHLPHSPVDTVSLGLLKGSTIDHVTELIGSSFRIIDNPQAKGSGSGCEVSREAKV